MEEAEDKAALAWFSPRLRGEILFFRRPISFASFAPFAVKGFC